MTRIPPTERPWDLFHFTGALEPLYHPDGESLPSIFRASLASLGRLLASCMPCAMQFLVFSPHRIPPSPRYRFFGSSAGLAITPKRAEPSGYGYSGMFHLPLAPCQYDPPRAVTRIGAREAVSSHNTVATLTVQAKDPSAVGI